MFIFRILGRLLYHNLQNAKYKMQNVKLIQKHYIVMHEHQQLQGKIAFVNDKTYLQLGNQMK